MYQTKFSLEKTQVDFLNNYQAYGFKDKSSVVRLALQHLQAEIEKRQLQESADLYAEIFAEDMGLQEWAENAIQDWPQ